MNNINSFFEKYYELKECNIEKIFMHSKTYLNLLALFEGIHKVGDSNHIWGNQTPIEYKEIGNEKVPLFNSIPIFIDDVGPEWAFVRSSEE